jgi:hypothetical protein
MAEGGKKAFTTQFRPFRKENEEINIILELKSHIRRGW